ncbi:MAG: class I SAM-dependent methyltransferase, partial [Chitinophagaceae bacterium]|nr:class I SAM-dependent methyltransferase [Chitinophagaceae bacterium]
LQNKNHYLRIYATVLEKAFAARNTTNVALLDFGTGNGLLALFAKFCGVEKVYASDVSSSFLQAAQQLSTQLNLPIEGWILGNEETLPHYFSTKSLDMVIGTDVIEHVYNLDQLFNTFNSINSNIITVFTTASVAENPIKSKQLKQLQLKDELEDSNAFQMAVENEFAGVCFLEVRKRIIQQYNTNLSNDIVLLLAKKTRGLKKDEIEKAVDFYIQKKILPIEINHPTNTCDPITGSWTERLLSIKEYKTIHLQHNKTLLVHLGFYNSSAKGVKGIFAAIVNVCLQIFGSIAMIITPFIILEGVPKKSTF